DTFTSVSAAAVWGYAVAPGSYVAGFGKNVAADSTVQLTDSIGKQASAAIVAAVEGQVNYLLPGDLPVGRYDVKLLAVWQVSASAALKPGNTTIPVSYAGPQNQFPGRDQVNAELPNSLAGAGEIPVSLTISGKPANAITVAFQ